MDQANRTMRQALERGELNSHPDGVPVLERTIRWYNEKGSYSAQGFFSSP
jgi:hypothetical protein